VAGASSSGSGPAAAKRTFGNFGAESHNESHSLHESGRKISHTKSRDGTDRIGLDRIGMDVPESVDNVQGDGKTDFI
jgi:hypothetical protein